jgi:hypothetical protein
MIGILPTFFWAIVVGLPALGFWAPTKVWPIDLWFVDKDYVRQYLLYSRNTLGWDLLLLAFVHMWSVLRKENTGEEVSGEMASWLFLGFLVVLCFIVIIHVLATRPLRYVVPVLLFAFGIGANFWYGVKIGQVIREKPAQYQVDLREGASPIYVTLGLPPRRQGIVFFKAHICDPAKGKESHFMPWSSIREMRVISDERRGCE